MLPAASQVPVQVGHGAARREAIKRIVSGANFTRHRLGSVHVTALRDGYVDMPVKRLRQPRNQPFGDDVPSQIPLHGGKLRLSVMPSSSKRTERWPLSIPVPLMLGCRPWVGCLWLWRRGADADAISIVALTHTHEDHINGLVLPGGGDAFPNLRQLWVPKAEGPLFRKEPRLARFHDRATPF